MRLKKMNVNKKYKKIILGLSILFVLLLAGINTVRADSTNTLLVPTLNTLEDIYQRLVSGTGAVAHSLFPSAVPAGTMHTLQSIFNLIDPAQPGALTNAKICSGTNSGTAYCATPDPCGPTGTYCDTKNGYWCGTDNACHNSCTILADCPASAIACVAGVCGTGLPGQPCGSMWGGDGDCVGNVYENCGTDAGNVLTGYTCGATGAGCTAGNQCVSGFCNTTCKPDGNVGTSCATGGNSACQYNNCGNNYGSGALCGGPGASCTSGLECDVSADAGCVGGTCKSNLGGHCYASGDCATSYCSGPIAGFNCTNGLLSDGCTDGTGCVSNACEPTLHTCLSALGGACTSNADCVTNYCDHDTLHCTDGSTGSGCAQDGDCANNNCGAEHSQYWFGFSYINRHICGSIYAPCSTGTDCLSGICAGGFCKSDVGGQCGIGLECNSGFCHVSGSACTSGAYLDACDNNTQCASGNCGGTTCAKMPDGWACTDNSQCNSNYCLTTARICGGGALGAQCDVGADCDSTICANMQHCVHASGGSCSGNFDCENNNCVSNICGGVGASCWLGNQCASGYCDTAAGGTTPGTCTTGFPGVQCGANTDCVHGNCYIYGGFPVWGECGVKGSTCSADADCTTVLPGYPHPICMGGVCNGLGSSCVNGTSYTICYNSSCGGSDGVTCGGENSTCTSGAECMSGYCNTRNNLCTTGAPGVTCGANGDCAAGNCDINTTWTCGAYGTSCSNGSQCTSGGCNLSVCQSALGGTCNANMHCVSAYCNSSGNVCTTGASGQSCGAGLDCVSGVCSGGVCITQNGLGGACASNADCTTNYCNTSAALCINGNTGDGCGMSSDCQYGNCASGSCGGNGASCSASSWCASSICGSWNNSCSAGTNGAFCAIGTDCLSNNCIGNMCYVAGYCSQGSDCGSSYCDTSAHTCTFGSTGIGCGANSDCQYGNCHNGTCGSNGASCSSSSDCVSGNCPSGTCVAGLGGPCNVNGDCGSGYCYSSGHVCTTGLAGVQCAQDSECVAGGVSGACFGGICGANGAGCSVNSDCVYNICETYDYKCTWGYVGDRCNSSSECFLTNVGSNNWCMNNYCDGLGADCNSSGPTQCMSGYCDDVLQHCSDGSPGSGCYYYYSCASMSCQGGANICD